jgi:hypothetical protein
MKLQSPLARRTLVLILALWIIISARAGAVVCSSDQAPAATLLIPYFEVDVSDAVCGGAAATNTIVNVTNATSAPTLVHVTLWTDMAVPALDFDIYLAGFDSQMIDLYEMFCSGILPSTGKAVSPHSPFSDPAVEFPNCNQTATIGDPPVYANPAISGAFQSHLRGWFTGVASPVRK